MYCHITSSKKTTKNIVTKYDLIREIQIKTTKRYYFASIRMVIIKKEKKVARFGENVEIWSAHTLLVRM